MPIAFQANGRRSVERHDSRFLREGQENGQREGTDTNSHTSLYFLFVSVLDGGEPSGYPLLSVTGSHQGFVLRKGISWLGPVSARLTLVEVANVWACKCHTVSSILYNTEVAM